MKRAFFVLLLQTAMAASFGQSENETISIIPEPVSITKASGHFVLPATINIATDENKELQMIAETFQKQLSIPTGYSTMVNEKAKSGNASIILSLNKSKV